MTMSQIEEVYEFETKRACRLVELKYEMSDEHYNVYENGELKGVFFNIDDDVKAIRNLAKWKYEIDAERLNKFLERKNMENLSGKRVFIKRVKHSK